MKDLQRHADKADGKGKLPPAERKAEKSPQLEIARVIWISLL
jgi:hypothetical protein